MQYNILCVVTWTMVVIVYSFLGYHKAPWPPCPSFNFGLNSEAGAGTVWINIEEILL